MPNTESGSGILLGICGAGGFAREVHPMAKEFLSKGSPTDIGAHRIVFVDSDPVENRLNDVPVLSEDDFFAVGCEQRYFNIAIRDSKIRERVASDFIDRGATPLSIQSANAVVYDRNEIAAGAIICPNSIITSNVRIGRFFHSNMACYVAHDCIIGDFVTLAPRVTCNGNVHIGDHAYIGAAATLIQGTKDEPLVIGEGAVVGMGAVVTKDVPALATVVGNPAKPLTKT